MISYENLWNVMKNKIRKAVFDETIAGTRNERPRLIEIVKQPIFILLNHLFCQFHLLKRIPRFLLGHPNLTHNKGFHMLHPIVLLDPLYR